jgi:hypothetical protein
VKIVALGCGVFFWVIVGVSGPARAQTNSWINSSEDAGQDATNRSLPQAPTNTQSTVITNDASKTVTIDSVTSASYPETMTVSNVVLSAPTGATNTLDLSGSGTNSPLSVLDTFTLSAGGLLRLTDATLWMRSVVADTPTNTVSITNGVLSVDGTVVLSTNGVLAVDSGMYVGLDPNACGSVWLTTGESSAGGKLTVTSTSPSAIGVNGLGQLVVSNGDVQVSSGFVFVGSGIGSQGAITVAGSNSYFSPYCHFSVSSLTRLVVGMETGATGIVRIGTQGQLVTTNSLVTIIGCDGSGELSLSNGPVSYGLNTNITSTLGSVEIGGNPGSSGTLTVAGGYNFSQAAMLIGSSPQATGTVWVTGGEFTQSGSYLISGQTNFWSTFVGPYGVGLITVSNGYWRGSAMILGSQSNSYGAVTVNGGSMTLLSKVLVGGTAVISNLVVGNCASGAVGVVNIDGGNLYITNAAHNAVLDVRDGQLILNSGVLQVDKLVMTNVCGLFVRNGGALVVTSSVLATNLDADGDGMLNGWEQAYGLDPLNAGDASADNDGDGLSNLQEFLAGTNPTNSASAFQITSVLTEGDDLRITWSVVTGKTYRVQRASDIATNAFSDLATVSVPATPAITQTNYLDVGAATNSMPRFYKIKLVTP